MTSLEQFAARAETAEREIEKLVLELEGIKSGNSGGGAKAEDAEDVPEELSKLRNENARLKYRLNILKKSCTKELAEANSNSMTNIAQTLINYFTEAIMSSYPALVGAPCPILPSSKGGDYQFNGAMTISGLLKAKGEKAIPRDVANNVVKNVPANDLIEKLEVAGPGFVNIYLKKSFIEASLSSLLEKGVLPPATGPKKKGRSGLLLSKHC